MIKKILVLMLLISFTVFGAGIHGVVYRWSDMEETPALVRVTAVDTEELVHQEITGESGYYSANLSEGNFIVEAFQGNLSTVQRINLQKEEFKRIDLVLFPSEDYLFPGLGDIPGYYDSNDPLIPEVIDFEEEEPEDTEEITPFVIYFALGVLSVLLALTYFLKIRGEKILKETQHVPSDEEEVLNILKKEGGETYQSRIKEETGFSAAKTSELLSKMEKEGKINRERKGREKIVKLEQ